MIPDHLIDKAARAMHADDLLEGEHEKFEDSPPWYQAIAERRARAALEAVAADIWDEGENIGYGHGQHDAHRFEPGPDYRETPNPYRASEAA